MKSAKQSNIASAAFPGFSGAGILRLAHKMNGCASFLRLSSDKKSSKGWGNCEVFIFEINLFFYHFVWMLSLVRWWIDSATASCSTRWSSLGCVIHGGIVIMVCISRRIQVVYVQHNWKVLAVLECASALLSAVSLGKGVWEPIMWAGLLVVIKNWSLGNCHGDLQPDLFPVESFGIFCTGVQMRRY